MQVKDLLLESLARANHCQRGYGAEASEVSMAEKQFNSQLRKYSDQNMVTAYQKVFDFTPTAESVVVGAPSYKKGVRVAEYATLPSADSVGSKMILGRDFAFSKETKKYYKAVHSHWTGTIKFSSFMSACVGGSISANQQVMDNSNPTGWYTIEATPITSTSGLTINLTSTADNPTDPVPTGIIVVSHHNLVVLKNGSNFSVSGDIKTKVEHFSWVEVQPSEICEWFPDIKLNDMERVMSVMKKDYTGRWCKLSFCPLTEFFCSSDNEIYNTTNAGENKVKFTFKAPSVNKEIKVVYNSSMKFGKNDYLELPEAHIELLILATTVAILMEDCDADQSQLNNYKIALKELEDQIIASTAVTRRIIREESQVRFSNRLDYLASNCWL